MLRSSVFGARSVATACLLFASIAAASCGSRTGLFGVGPGALDGGTPPDAGLDGAVKCTPGKVSLELARPQLMFVLDRSGSMAFSLGGQDTVPPGQLSRWETLRTSLEQTIVPFDNQLAMGAKFFPELIPADAPDEPASACRTDTGVPIAPSLGNARTILDVFDTTTPLGGTPTAEALRIAAEDLERRRTVARTIVLATDGAPNCNGALDAQTCTCTTPRLDCGRNPNRGRYSCLDDTQSVRVVTDIFQNKKIPVYVIGIGSTERADFLGVLDDMAVAGGRARSGTPKHYNVQTAQELSNALTTIRDSIAKCTYLTPSAPTDPNAITVEIDERQIPRDVTQQNGWDWIDQTFGEIAFFGSACTAAAGTAQVTGVVTCQDP